MTVHLGWNCDFCKKACITMSLAGILYCDNCRMSYGEQPHKILEEKLRKQNEHKLKL